MKFSCVWCTRRKQTAERLRNGGSCGRPIKSKKFQTELSFHSVALFNMRSRIVLSYNIARTSKDIFLKIPLKSFHMKIFYLHGYNPGQNILGHLRKLGTKMHFAK